MPGEFDELCERTTERYLGMSELPSVYEVNGQQMASFSTTLDAAELEVAELSKDDKLAVVADLLDDPRELTVDYSIVDDEVHRKTPVQIFDEIIVYILSNTIDTDPIVEARQASNLQTFSALPPSQQE